MNRNERFLVAGLAAIAIGIGVAIGVSSLGGHNHAAAKPTGPQASKAEQHAVGVLSAFVYERGSWWAGGNVKACHANWAPAPHVVAQIYCTAFGQSAVYERFDSSGRAAAYFSTLASQGNASSSGWGQCGPWAPRRHWSRTIFGGKKESGTVAFRENGDRAYVVWNWPNIQTVAEAQGTIGDLSQLCNAWDMNG